jgi:hypothetical protein
MSARIISINRAPVLTLWAAVVAQRLATDELNVAMVVRLAREKP